MIQDAGKQGIRVSRHWPTSLALMGASLLFALAGCSPAGVGLPLTGVLPGDNTLVGPLPDDEVLSSGGPLCARIGKTKTATQQSMYEALNVYRSQRGLTPLLYSEALEASAQAQAEDLWKRGFFSHINPDGEDPGARAVRIGFCHPFVGENIAAGQRTVEQVMQAWKDSPSHNINMIEPEYVYVGMGFSTDAFGRRYWAQVFAYDVPGVR